MFITLGNAFSTLRLKASRDDILAQKEQNPDVLEALRYFQVKSWTILYPINQSNLGIITTNE